MFTYGCCLELPPLLQSYYPQDGSELLAEDPQSPTPGPVSRPSLGFCSLHEERPASWSWLSPHNSSLLEGFQLPALRPPAPVVCSHPQPRPRCQQATGGVPNCPHPRPSPSSLKGTNFPCVSIGNVSSLPSHGCSPRPEPSLPPGRSRGPPTWSLPPACPHADPPPSFVQQYSRKHNFDDLTSLAIILQWFPMVEQINPQLLSMEKVVLHNRVASACPAVCPGSQGPTRPGSTLSIPCWCPRVLRVPPQPLLEEHVTSQRHVL